MRRYTVSGSWPPPATYRSTSTRCLSQTSSRRVSLPGALSAAQLTAISGSVVAQRRSIEALKAQLSSFDEQLAVLEQILSPLTEWSRTWAQVEERLLTMSHGPAAENPDGSLRPG